MLDCALKCGEFGFSCSSNMTFGRVVGTFDKNSGKIRYIDTSGMTNVIRM